MFDPRPGRGSNLGPRDWEAEIFTTAPTLPLYSAGNKLSTCRSENVNL